MAYDPIHYPIGDIFSPYKEILSCNNGHRNIPAWAVPESEVPLICSEKEWEQIQQREFEKIYPKNTYIRGAEEETHLLAPRKRDSGYNSGYVHEVRAGRWTERRLSSMVSGGCKIRVLPGEAIDTDTGEVLRPYVRLKDCYYNDDGDIEYCIDDVRGMVRHASRADNLRSVKQSCERFKWLVRANERKVRLFVTLTYAENMTDTKRLYEDSRRFFAKVKRRFAVTGYLCACEPQKRGAWHCHILLLSNRPLYIPNRQINKLWGHGFTKVQACRSVRDVGTYLTSYLSNLKDGKGTKKNARLALYPLGFRFTRWSRDVEKPENTRFYGNFGDHFLNALDFELCFDFQNRRRLETGETVLSRVALFCREKPK